ncbi:MAG: hypothetical protein FJX72_06660 [Armatimonadetes bacterium]|nr:hypothetical protein [Armatimonadota bacterium]
MIAPDLPVYNCPRVSQALVVNGLPGEECWRAAPVVRLVDSGGGKRAVLPTVVRCCWTDSHLFLRFSCKDPDMWGSLTDRDAELFNEEVVEVFLAPSGDVRRYFEFEVSPHNVVFDAALHSPDRDRRTMTTDVAWDCADLQTRVVSDGPIHRVAPRGRAEAGPEGRWTVDMAIPFRSLGLAGAPDPGAEWRMNLYRIDRGARSEYASWSPTMKQPADFHVPDRFGTLRFDSDEGQAVVAGRWSVERAQSWRQRTGQLLGCNFIPSTASNQLEMWQAETFDPATIDRELGYAAGLGMNAVRVYLHDLAWLTDSKGFMQRLRTFLGLASRHGIGVVLVLFDDCWNPDPVIGPQEAPRPGVHNSRWLQSPGAKLAAEPLEWGPLADYVRSVVGALRSDRRVLVWDLFNEPGNSERGASSLPLLQCAFEWARSADPSQPLTVGVWADHASLNAFQLANSDVITLHNYGEADALRAQISDLRVHGRPLVCTEWMARPGSTIPTHLPVFREERVGCLNWGLVAGKTQTIYPWRSPEGGPEPAVWFHDLLRADGSPYDRKEAELMREFAAATETRKR